jgi:LuxR family maltose regulon positive regulatory protein
VPRKHDIPPSPRHEIRRRHLTTRLAESFAARCTLVSGPAGSGKTVGVAQWARAIAPTVAWLRLDDRDNDVRRFRTRVLAALPRTTAVADEDEAITSGVEGLRDEAVLVCDGVDALSDPVTLADLDALCAESPPPLHVVLVGRWIPRLPAVPRLRLAGELLEITRDDLRCREEEVTTLLDVLGCAAGADERTELLEHSEGLIAAIALAGVLARGHPERNPLKSFGGATEEVAQYLYTEVIGPLAVDVLGFMLATSVLERLDPDACDEITGRSDSRALLADLARRNVMTEALDGGASYRYHTLLHEFLRSELRRTQPERLYALHRAAASHYERRDDEDGALVHWIEAGEFEQAWTRFRRRAMPRFWDGAVTAVARWTAILPKPKRTVDIGHALDMSLALLHMGAVDDASDWYDLIDAELGTSEPDPETLARKTYIEFLLDFAHGDLLRAARRATDARRLLAHSDWSWDELRAPSAHAQLQTMLGHPGRARATLGEFVERFKPVTPLDRIAVDAVLGDAALNEGRLTEAAQRARRAIQRAARLPDPEFWFMVEPRWVLGFVHLEQNQLDEALVELEHACELANRQGFLHAQVIPLAGLARVQHLSGDLELAHASIARARHVLRRWEGTPLQQRVEETNAIMAIADGDFARAAAIVEKLATPGRARLAARLHIERGAYAEAAVTLEQATAATLRDRIELLLLRARCAGDDASTVTLLRQALELAEPERFTRLFVDEAAWLGPSVRRLVGSWPTGFAAEVAGAIAAEPERRVASRTLAGLSGREQEVWRFLSTSLSMQEIADALYVSRNTLKSHVRSIYRKLGVGTREAAVGRGNVRPRIGA